MLSAPALLDSVSRMLDEALGVRQRPEANGGRLQVGMALSQRQRAMLGRGAHQAHPAGPAHCARLGSPLLHLQQRAKFSTLYQGSSSLTGADVILLERCMMSALWRYDFLAGWSAVRLMGILIEISLQIIAIEQHHSAPWPACCITAPGVRGCRAHQGLALFEGPAQRLEEAEEHR